jgi:hypothetical protein
MSWKDRAKPVVTSSEPSSSGGSWKSRATPITKRNEVEKSAFERFGGALPVAGSVLGGLVGGVGGTVAGMGVGGVPGAIGGATLGGAAGEAGRQLLGRAIGEEVTDTPEREILKEGVMGGVGEVAGMGIGSLAAKGYKAFPKIAHSFSGTPATNIARAQQRGFKVFAPGISREAAGKAQAAVEHPLIEKLFTPVERVLIRDKDAGFANKLARSVMLKQERGLPITAKEAIGLRVMAPVKRAADTMKGIRKNVELDKATTGARGVIAEQFPELTKRLGSTERAITASQLRNILPVNKTNPDQISKLGTLLSVLSGSMALPLASPLSMGLAGATMGQVKKSISPMVRRAIQRGGIQSLERALSE